MPEPTLRVAVLDDYQRVAARCADWSALQPDAEVAFFHDHLADPEALAARLAPFHAICAMRERTPFDAALLARLPNLSLLVTTGAANDIERATEIARKMVCEWGMSDEMGPLAYGKKDEQIFLGREIAQSKDYSERTAQAIDRAVKRIVSENFQGARQLLVENIDKLHKLAKALLEQEVLDANQITEIIAPSAS